MATLPAELLGLQGRAAPAARRTRSRRFASLRPQAVAASAPGWSPDSWRTKKMYQMPEYKDPKALEAALVELRRCPPLIFAGEVCLLWL
jgi:Class-II DAHP synthetase family